MNNLRKDFTVLSASEAQLEWQEFKKWPQTFKFTLQHPSFHRGIQLQFYAIRKKNTLYPLDSLHRTLPALAGRIQNVKFLMDYLNENPTRKINLFFFNNRAITRKRIDDFNKDPKHWQMHDAWVEMMNLYNSGEIKPSFNVDESIETSKQVNYGCNFRLDNTGLLQSVLFELRDENDQSSTWVLLPDNTPVLWYFQGENVYKYSYHDLGTKGRSVQDVCKKFDAQGNILP